MVAGAPRAVSSTPLRARSPSIRAKIPRLPALGLIDVDNIRISRSSNARYLDLAHIRRRFAYLGADIGFARCRRFSFSTHGTRMRKNMCGYQRPGPWPPSRSPLGTYTTAPRANATAGALFRSRAHLAWHGENPGLRTALPLRQKPLHQIVPHRAPQRRQEAPHPTKLLHKVT